VVPASVLLLNGFSVFWYQTMDAIDGKQARRINNCSPLGQILDHTFDQFSHCFFVVMLINCIRGGQYLPHVMMIMAGQLFPHFLIEYRAFFTHYHPTAEKLLGGIEIGATETCMIMYFLLWGFAFTGNECALNDLFNFGKPFGLPF